MPAHTSCQTWADSLRRRHPGRYHVQCGISTTAGSYSINTHRNGFEPQRGAVTSVQVKGPTAFTTPAVRQSTNHQTDPNHNFDSYIAIANALLPTWSRARVGWVGRICSRRRTLRFVPHLTAPLHIRSTPHVARLGRLIDHRDGSSARVCGTRFELAATRPSCRFWARGNGRGGWRQRLLQLRREGERHRTGLPHYNLQRGGRRGEEIGDGCTGTHDAPGHETSVDWGNEWSST